MATFLNDTMTGTAGTLLTAHTGETGATWTVHPNFTNTGVVITNANRIRGNVTATNFFHYASGVPATADYDVAAVLYTASIPSDTSTGVVGRMSTSANTYYLARYDKNGTNWELRSTVAGTGASLGTYSQTLTVGQTYTLTLMMRGTTISLLVDGVTRISVTNSGITAAGRAGIYLGSTGGTYTDTTYIQIDSITASDPPALTVVAINDANLSLSPANWEVSGSTYAQTTCAGAYLKCGFSGTTVALNVDVTPLTGGSSAAGDYPNFRWSIDGGAATTRQLLSSDTVIALASGLAAGNHTLFLQLITSAGIAANALTNDHWTTPVAAFRVTGLSVDSGSASVAGNTVQAGFVRTRRMVLFGDSITIGWRAGATLNNHDAENAYGLHLGEALDAEIGIIAYTQQGWQVAALGGVPKFFTSGDATNTAYDKHHSGTTRTFTGIDYAVVVHGANDANSAVADATVTSTVTAWLTAARTAFGASTRIFVVVPFGQFKASAILAATLPDSRCTFVNLGTELAVGLGNVNSPTRRALDALHPQFLGHMEIAARLATALDAILTGGPVGRAPASTIGGGGASQWR